MSGMPYPNRDDIAEMVKSNIYSGRILNNAHRGDVIEMMVLSALGEDWKFVGLGWHPWDLESGSGSERVRIQVKQCAALQLWGPTKKLTISFGWSSKPPSYFERDNPGVPIEAEGWFCEVFVCGVHQEADPAKADQLDPQQWEFLVISTEDLRPKINTMVLNKALRNWPLRKWHELPEAVEAAFANRRASCGQCMI